MRVLIAGCGDLGTEAGLRFAGAGHDVVGVRRSANLLPAQIRPLAADLADEGLELPGDVDVLVIAVAADGRSEELYRKAYVDGVGNVLDALERAGAHPERVLFVSSTAVYGDAGGGWVDEDTPTAPSSATGAVLVEAEQTVLRRRPDAVVLRLSGIYGPGRTALIDRVRDGSAKLPENPVYANRIHRDDAAQAIVHLTAEVAHPEQVYVGVDDAPAERGEVIRFLAQQLGVDVPPVGQPVGRSAGQESKRCRNDRLKSTGLALAYPTFREGYTAVLAGQGSRHP